MILYPQCNINNLKAVLEITEVNYYSDRRRKRGIIISKDLKKSRAKVNIKKKKFNKI